MQMVEQGSHPVLAVKTARVGDFNGKTLSTLNTSMLNLDPDIPEAGRLRNWYVLQRLSLATLCRTDLLLPSNMLDKSACWRCLTLIHHN